MSRIRLFQDHSKEVAGKLLDIGAIKLRPSEPFVWSSGWNSPIYCDNRLSLSYPKIRNYIKNLLSEAIKFHFPEAEVVSGVATAGIAQGALVADQLELPMNYVRAKPKGHGMGNMIEGLVQPGKKVVVLEDLISTGGSSLAATKALIDAGFEVLGMVAIFTYGFKIAEENFEKENISLVVLSDYFALLDEAIKRNYIDSDKLEALQSWRDNPATWKG